MIINIFAIVGGVWKTTRAPSTKFSSSGCFKESKSTTNVAELSISIGLLLHILSEFLLFRRILKTRSHHWELHKSVNLIYWRGGEERGHVDIIDS